MMNSVQSIAAPPSAFPIGNLPMRKMLTSALPFIAVAVPGTAYAQVDPSNTAWISVPSGAIDTDPTNNSATDTDTLLAAILANDDTASGAFGFAGATDVLSVLGNDSSNGAAATTGNVTIAVASGSSVPAGLTFDTADGTIDVAAGTASGVYTFDYTICEAGQPTNCDTATATVTVTDPAILADPDSATGVDGVAGVADVVNVLDGDTIDGVAATTSNVVITVASGSSVPAGLTFDTTDGGVSVDPGTPAGVYTFDYTICDAINPSNCDTNTVSITVDAPVIVADPDAVTGVDSLAGGTDVLNVLDGDTIGGNPATTSTVTISVASGSSVPAGLTFDTTDGGVSVAPNTPAGVYTFDYTICDVLNPTNCDTNTVSVTVEAPTILADPDGATGVDGVAGQSNVLNVLDGDTIGGAAATTSNVVITVASGSSVPAGLTFNTADGSVSVDPATPAGVYTFDYTICDAVNPSNCDTNTVSITVDAPVIVADPDTVTGINGADGGTDVVNVLDGDTIGGSPATPSTVTISVASGSSVPTGLTFDTTDGGVSVDPGTPAGVYTFDYTICDVLNPTNCETNTVSVTVDAPVIDAVNDSSLDINGADGGTNVINVLDNDTLNGGAATVSNVTLAVATTSSVPAGLTFDITDGSVDVAAGTAAGVYTFDYTICEVINPTNCDTATATVNVVAPAITADDDSVTGLSGVAGSADVLDVLAGDTLNGVQTDITEVSISIVTPASGSGNVPFIDLTTGQVQVPANTPGGTYTIVYEIEDRNNPGNTAQATATVTIAPTVDLSITKTNGVTTVQSGDVVTYTLVVSNAGPDAAVGAVVTDVPGAGLSCPGGNTVTLTGDGVPVGSFTIADLTGAGITLGSLAAGESTTITYSCSID